MDRELTGLDVANDMPITGELLSDVYTMQASMLAAERGNADVLKQRIASLLKEKGVHEDYQLRALVVSIMLRQRALEILVQDNEVRGFTLTSGAEKATVHQDLFRCAGEEKLVWVGDKARFNPESFRLRLLSFTTTAGRA